MSRRHLFYPSSGTDFRMPIQMCIRDIDEFWFVDPRYDGGGSDFYPIDTREAAQKMQRYLRGFDLVDITQTQLEGHTQKKAPYLVVQNTIHFYSRREERHLHIHLCGGLGFNAFRSIFDGTGRSLNIFFYQRDSEGEGGSGFFWLSWRLKSVLKRISHNGLIISDGSNARENFRRHRKGETPSPFEYYRWILTPLHIAEAFASPHRRSLPLKSPPKSRPRLMAWRIQNRRLLT